nr:hypothetical protein [Skermanella stibiiresistens]
MKYGDVTCHQRRHLSGIGRYPQIGDGNLCFDNSIGTLKLPVSPLRGGTGIVDGCGNIRSCRLGKSFQELRASGIAADVAAVEENVAVAGERRANGRERVSVFASYRVPFQRGGAKQQPCFLTMTDDVDGIDASTTLKVVGHLRDAVFGGIDLHDFHVASQIVAQDLPIGHARVDEGDFDARRCGFRRPQLSSRSDFIRGRRLDCRCGWHIRLGCLCRGV